MYSKTAFNMRPIGVVQSEPSAIAPKYPVNCPAEIRIHAEFLPGLARLHEHSHIWVLCLYTPPEGTDSPLQINPPHFVLDGEPYGVFSLRSPNHPNPISLTLCKLIDIIDDRILVDNLDAYNGTPVLDIKPYLLHDSVFSPHLPTIRHKKENRHLDYLCALVMSHHQEKCIGAALAVKTVCRLEELGFHIQDPALRLRVQGSPCYADALQGLSRARLANPPRFEYVNPGAPSAQGTDIAQQACTCMMPDKQVTLCVKKDLPASYEEILSCDYASLFL